MMARLSDKDRQALRFGGAASVVIVAVVFLGMPAYDAFASRARTLGARQREIRNIRNDMEDAVASAELLKELQGKATLYETARAVQEQPARVQQQVEQIPAYSRLAVRRVESSPLRREQEFASTAVSIQFGGTLPNLVDFLEGVEAARPRLKVERLTLGTDRKQPDRIDGQVVVTGYAVLMEEEKRR